MFAGILLYGHYDCYWATPSGRLPSPSNIKQRSKSSFENMNLKHDRHQQNCKRYYFVDAYFGVPLVEGSGCCKKVDATFVLV